MVTERCSEYRKQVVIIGSCASYISKSGYEVVWCEQISQIICIMCSSQLAKGNSRCCMMNDVNRRGRSNYGKVRLLVID